MASKRDIIHEYIDTLLIFLLKGGRPNKYHDNVRQEVTRQMVLRRFPTRS